MKTEAGLLSLHLNSNDKPSAEATSSSLVSIFLSLVQKKNQKKKITNQLNKISMLMHVPRCIHFRPG